MQRLLQPLRAWARQLKSEVLALWYCVRHPRTPFLAKALAALIVAYALSPIDLIPDFIPVLGLLDELVLLPAGLWLALKLVPADVMAECRAEAARKLAEQRPPRGRLATALIVALIVAIWIAAAALVIHWLL